MATTLPVPFQMGTAMAPRLTAPAALAERQQAADTFEAVVDRFLPQYSKTVKAKSYGESERCLLMAAKPLHSKPIAAVAQRDIAEVLSIHGRRAFGACGSGGTCDRSVGFSRPFGRSHQNLAAGSF
jgi:hypothetical protein